MIRSAETRYTILLLDLTFHAETILNHHIIYKISCYHVHQFTDRFLIYVCIRAIAVAVAAAGNLILVSPALIHIKQSFCWLFTVFVDAHYAVHVYV